MALNEPARYVLSALEADGAIKYGLGDKKENKREARKKVMEWYLKRKEQRA